MIDMLDCKDHYTRVLIHKLGRFCEKSHQRNDTHHLAWKGNLEQAPSGIIIRSTGGVDGDWCFDGIFLAPWIPCSSTLLTQPGWISIGIVIKYITFYSTL